LSFLCFPAYRKKNIPAIPAAIYEPSMSLAVLATYMAFVIKITYNTIIPAPTTNPNSSPITEI
jgi:hypothetical protein